MDTLKHKTISVVLSVAAMYFGFQGLDLASGLYQMEIFFSLAWYIFAFHIIWLLFMFDLHFKRARNAQGSLAEIMSTPAIWESLKNRTRHLYHWSYVRRYLNYFILPSLMYWSMVVLIYLNPFHELFKDGLIIITSACLAVIYWHLKEVFSHEAELKHVSLRLLSLIKLFTAFLVFTATFAASWYFGINWKLATVVAGLASVLLAYQSMFQHKLINSKTWTALIWLAATIAVVFSIVYLNWNVNYYTAGLAVAVVYTCMWAVLHHYVASNLTRTLLWEYTFTMIVLLAVILSTHDFQGRI